MSKSLVNKEFREALAAILVMLYDYEDSNESLYKAADELSIDRGTARQAIEELKGSVDTYGGLILKAFDIEPRDLKKYVPKIRKVLSKDSKVTTITELMEEARVLYGENELTVWLKLLLAKYKIEDELGFRTRGRKKKS